MKNYNRITLTVFLLLFPFFVFAQSNDTLFIQKDAKGNARFVRFTSGKNQERNMNKDTVFLKTFYKTDKNDGFRKIQEGSLPKDIPFKKFQQYYKGLQVDNAQVIIYGKNNNIEVVTGDFQDIDIENVKPSLNEEQALKKALAFVGAKKYKWEDKSIKASLKENTANSKATYFPKGELVIAKDNLK